MPEPSRPNNSADSAGVPWQGRSFGQHSDEFAQDAGLTPPALAEAISKFRAGEMSYPDVAQVFAKSRVLIPLVTVAGEIGETPDGRIVDKTQELSIVTVQAPDGRKVLPVFSSVAAMTRWNKDARPVPNMGLSVVVAALDEENDLVILDPMDELTELGIRRPMLWSLVTGEYLAPCWEDPEVRREFESAVREEPFVTGVHLTCGDPEARLVTPELVVTISIEQGLTQDDLEGLLTRLQARWGASEIIASRVDSMKLQLAATPDSV